MAQVWGWLAAASSRTPASGRTLRRTSCAKGSPRMSLRSSCMLVSNARFKDDGLLVVGGSFSERMELIGAMRKPPECFAIEIESSDSCCANMLDRLITKVTMNEVADERNDECCLHHNNCGEVHELVAASVAHVEPSGPGPRIVACRLDPAVQKRVLKPCRCCKSSMALRSSIFQRCPVHPWLRAAPELRARSGNGGALVRPCWACATFSRTLV